MRVIFSERAASRPLDARQPRGFAAATPPPSGGLREIRESATLPRLRRPGGLRSAATTFARWKKWRRGSGAGVGGKMGQVVRWACHSADMASFTLVAMRLKSRQIVDAPSARAMPARRPAAAVARGEEVWRDMAGARKTRRRLLHSA